MIERQVEISTPDGGMNTFICHPERDGPHPTVMFLMDAPGIREELRDMARRLGTVGYYVMLPNLYYRSGVEELGQFVGDAYVATRQLYMQLMGSINIPMVMSDIDALLEFADRDRASAGPTGCVGYCMSGRYAMNAAMRHPERVRAAASIYGVELITDSPDSPHLAMQRTAGRLYFGCAEIDTYAPQETIDKLRAEATERGNVEVEVYPGTHHGFAFPQRPAYHKAAAEKHWERLFSLFRDALR